MKKICALLLLFVVCISLCSCGIGQNGLKDLFDAWEKENDSNIAIFDERKDVVIVNGENISLDEILKSHYENTSDELILCVIDNKI